MDLSKMIKNLEAEQQETQPDGQQFSKEEYAAMKKAEREEVWARVDAQAQAVFQDNASMKGFLDFMARCTPQSTRNLLILYEQNPEITHPRTFNMWAEAGRSVRNGESGYTFFAESKYQREDGTTGRGYDIVKAFNINQTRGPQPYPAHSHLPDEVIAAAKYYDPARMTRYAMDVAALYHKFYQNCRVKCEDSAVCAARAALCRATATVLENTLAMLKITAPEVM